MRSPIEKILRLIVPSVMVAVFLYGIIFYPDAPYVRCSHGFCGKTGHHHSEAEFYACNLWQAALAFVWLIGLPICFALSRIDRGR